MRKSRREILFAASLAVFLVAYLALELAFALRLRIDYYDGLETLRNARRLLGADVGFSTNRMPMLALLHLPAQLLLSAAGAGDVARVVVPHLFQLALSAAFLALAYRWFRLSLPAPWSALALALLALDRMTVHYFCFALSDIPCALFLVLFLLLERRPVWAALALGACLCTRSNMLIAPFVYVGCLAALFLLERRLDLRAALRASAVAACAGALFVVVNVLVYRRVFPFGFAESVSFLHSTLRSHLAHNSAPEPFWNYAPMLASAAGPAASLLFLLGAWRLIRVKRLDALLPLALFASLFAAMSAIGHKEARYLYPVMPVFYLVTVGELRSLAEALRGSARAALIALVVVSSAAGAAHEAYNLADPAYGNEVLVRLPGLVRGLSRPGSKVFWEGAYYWAVPSRRGFSSADPGFYVFNVPSPASLAYLLGAPIMRPNRSAVAEGDLVVRAPAAPDRMSADNRVEVLVFGRDATLTRAALLPPAPR